MKKLISVLLCVLFALSLAACGSEEDDDDTTKRRKKDDYSDSSSDPEERGDGKTAYTLENYSVAETDQYAFSVTSVKKTGGDVVLKVLCENKTADKTLRFSWDDVSVMFYVIDPFWGTTVAAGKKSNSEIRFSGDSMKECGIKSADEISFRLRVSDDDDVFADPLCDTVYSVYPTGKTSVDVFPAERPAAPGEKVIYDENGVKLIIVSAGTSDFWGYGVNLYLQNDTEKTVSFYWDDVSVNDFMADPFWGTSVPAGRRKYTTVCFSQSTFDENGISDVQKIEFRLKIKDEDSWEYNILDKVFTYNP